MSSHLLAAPSPLPAAMSVTLQPLPPLDAIRALLARGERLDPSFVWLDRWQEDHAAMFTVARSAGYDVLQEIFEALLKALQEGKTYREFAAELTPLLQAKGWWGRQWTVDPITGERVVSQLGSARRLQTIFDANMRVSYAAGHWASFERAKADRPYLRYVAILDEATRPQHAARHNLVLPVDDPYWFCGGQTRRTIMDWQTQARIIANDLNSMTARIEALPAHPKMTDALVAVQAAEKSLREGWGDLHQEEMRQRHRRTA